MESTTYNRPQVSADNGQFLVGKFARNYGLLLGIITSVYLTVINFGDGEPGTGLRFAKHVFIIPIVWFAISSYAKRLPEGRAFKRELGLLLRMALWSALAISVINVLSFAVLGTSFEQFMHEGDTFAGVMINSGFLFFETVVFVMIIGFVILQAYKGAGSPED